MNLQQILMQFFQRYLLNYALRIRYVGSLKREQKFSRWQGYAKVLAAIFTYPLAAAQAEKHLLTISNPRPLKTWAEVEDAYQRTIALGLPPHKGREKNWDFLAAFSAIFKQYPRNATIVDLGSGPQSVILEWLHLYGYPHLYGSDLMIQAPLQRGHIQYSHQDLEQTTYPAQFADVVTCLSVIEHGVNPERMLAEASRLLKSGGMLLISTDFWCTERDLSGVHDELGQVYVYSPASLQQRWLDAAPRFGFTTIGTPDFACEEAVVNRPNVPALHKQYTFYFMGFTKQ